MSERAGMQLDTGTPVVVVRNHQPVPRSMAGFTIVPNGRDVLKPWQAMYAGNGIQAVQRSVPDRPLQEGERLAQFFVLTPDEVPIGLLSVIEMSGEMVEFGARFWEQNSGIAFLLDGWMRGLLGAYSAVVVRCFSSNRRVKRLLQRGGFRLFGFEGTPRGRVEFYLVTPNAYMGREAGREVDHG